MTTTPAIAAGKRPHLHSYTHPKFKRKKIFYVALILTFLQLAGDNDFHFAHHGRFVVETATIMTRLLSSDTRNPIEQQLLNITMPHLHPNHPFLILLNNNNFYISPCRMWNPPWQFPLTSTRRVLLLSTWKPYGYNPPDHALQSDEIKKEEHDNNINNADWHYNFIHHLMQQFDHQSLWTTTSAYSCHAAHKSLLDSFHWHRPESNQLETPGYNPTDHALQSEEIKKEDHNNIPIHEESIPWLPTNSPPCWAQYTQIF